MDGQSDDETFSSLSKYKVIPKPQHRDSVDTIELLNEISNYAGDDDNSRAITADLSDPEQDAYEALAKAASSVQGNAVDGDETSLSPSRSSTIRSANGQSNKEVHRTHQRPNGPNNDKKANDADSSSSVRLSLCSNLQLDMNRLVGPISGDSQNRRSIDSADAGNDANGSSAGAPKRRHVASHGRESDENSVNSSDDSELLLTVETADLAHLEPKLRDAWIQMRLLDKKLSIVSKRERQVKRETQLLVQKSRAELDLLRLTSDHKESKLEAENTAHFLALSYVDIDDELTGAARVGNGNYEDDDDDDDEHLMTPLFKTQLPDMDGAKSEIATDGAVGADQTRIDDRSKAASKSNAKGSTTGADASQKAKKDRGRSIASSSSSAAAAAATATATASGVGKQASADKDFIKRNIKLAQDAGGILSMTEEEKQRLNELLLDADDFDNSGSTSDSRRQAREQVVVGAGNDDQSNFVVEYNPNAVSLLDGDGFTLEKQDSLRMKQIDSALEQRSVSSSQRASTRHNSSVTSLLTATGSHQNLTRDMLQLGVESTLIRLNDDFDENEFGDKFIREARITREQELRLRHIDTQLETIRATRQGGLNGAAASVDQLSSSQSEMSSAERSSSVVSLASEQQIKQLIEEFAIENKFLRNDQKSLSVLREEDNENFDVSTWKTDAEAGQLQVCIDDQRIKSLLEEARNEGIFIQTEPNSRPDEHSFYREALEIVNTYNEERQRGGNCSERSHERIDEGTARGNDLFDDNRVSTESSNRLNLEESKSRRACSQQQLPLLRPSFRSEPSDDLSLEQCDENRSVSSPFTSNKTVVLPKIDDRFLPSNK